MSLPRKFSNFFETNGRKKSKASQLGFHQTMILEQILTPSPISLVDELGDIEAGIDVDDTLDFDKTSDDTQKVDLAITKVDLDEEDINTESFLGEEINGSELSDPIDFIEILEEEPEWLEVDKLNVSNSDEDGLNLLREEAEFTITELNEEGDIGEISAIEDKDVNNISAVENIIDEDVDSKDFENPLTLGHDTKSSGTDLTESEVTSKAGGDISGTNQPKVTEADDTTIPEASTAVKPNYKSGDSTEQSLFEESMRFPLGNEEKSLIEEGLASKDLVSGLSSFDQGVFIVGEDGVVKIDYLFDGGAYEGELGLFNLEGFDKFEYGSKEFIAEAARRSLSASNDGYVIIIDRLDSAKFSGDLGEGHRNWNLGHYQGTKTFTLREGDRFALMLVPDGSIQQVAESPIIGGRFRPLFSLATANPEDVIMLVKSLM